MYDDERGVRTAGTSINSRTSPGSTGPRNGQQHPVMVVTMRSFGAASPQIQFRRVAVARGIRAVSTTRPMLATPRVRWVSVADRGSGGPLRSLPLFTPPLRGPPRRY